MDYQEIYARHADRYDALVEAEDCDGNLLPALESVASLKGARVLEVGVGTGRVTRLVAPLAKSVVGVERSPAMLAIARKHLAGAPHCTLIEGEATRLPVEAGEADVAIAAWVFGHFRHWMPEHWRDEITRAIDEMRRALTPDGTLVIIETLGTGSAEPRPPNDSLAEYYTWLEHVHGFTRKTIRTDYRFTDVDRAAEVTGFFFGEDFARRVRSEQWSRVPECTGVWSRHLRRPH